MKHTISVLVENKFGVLARVASLFSARGFNIDSLAVGETEDPTVSRMTIVAKGDERTLEQIKKQLNKLIDVIKVYDFLGKPCIDRELILLRVNMNPRSRKEIMEIAESAGGVITHAGSKSLTIQAVGDQTKIDSLIELLKPFGIRELVRTGRVALGTEHEVTIKSQTGKNEK
jgi:acetolactate synthase-1/3 small subunit